MLTLPLYTYSHMSITGSACITRVTFVKRKNESPHHTAECTLLGIHFVHSVTHSFTVGAANTILTIDTSPAILAFDTSLAVRTLDTPFAILTSSATFT